MKCFLLAIFALQIGLAQQSSESSSQKSTYREIEVSKGGTIQGVVRLSGEQPSIENMVITKDNKHCGTSKKSPRLKVGKDGAVADAIIHLENIAEGKPIPSTSRYVLDQKRCEYTPHVMILPLGSQLEIVNSDPILHNVHAYQDRPGAKTVFNIAQPIKGQRTPIKQAQLNRPGLIVATCDAGHPWMSASIMVAEHPYFAITDRNGRFVLRDVPPGTYKVRMWHEGVNITEKQMEHGKAKKYEFEEPYVVTKEVTVAEHGDVRADFEFALRQVGEK